MNTLKTVFLMTLMMVLFLLVGQALGGRTGLAYALIFSLGMNFMMYWFSDKIVLMMYHAQQVSEQDAPRLFRIIRELTTSASLPMPKVYIIPSPTPNAFATGRNPEHAAVAVTEGILNILSDDELSGVLGHELAHVKHRDILTGTIVATMVGTITFLARMAGWSLFFFGGSRDDRRDGGALGELFLIIVAPLAAMLLQLAISRSREFAADEGGARISGRPLSLASALRKLAAGAERIPMTNASPSSAHLFIVNPLRGSSIMKLFSTHPPIEERIARLEELAVRGFAP
ncbi:MAG: zinc metalloprotease HtpX [Bacteroidota bacterium]